MLWVHVPLFWVLFQTLVRGKHKSVFLATQNKFWLLLSGQVDGITFLLNSKTSRSCHGHVCYSLFAWPRKRRRKGLKWSWNKFSEWSGLIRIGTKADWAAHPSCWATRKRRITIRLPLYFEEKDRHKYQILKSASLWREMPSKHIFDNYWNSAHWHGYNFFPIQKL